MNAKRQLHLNAFIFGRGTTPWVGATPIPIPTASATSLTARG